MPTISRRRLMRAALASAGGAALAACGLPLAPSAPPTPVPQTITVWSWIADAGPTIVRAFEERHPQITVKLEAGGYGATHERLLRALTSGEGGPDVCMIDLPYLGQLRATGGLADLGGPPFDGAGLASSFVPALWDACAHQGRQIALPWNMGLGLCWYRPDLLEAAGLPSEPERLAQDAATWEGWLALDTALRRASPKVRLISAAEELFDPRVAQQGYGWVDGDRLLVEEKGLPAAELAAAALERDVLATAPGNTTGRALADGSLAGMVSPSWMQFFLMRDMPASAGRWRILRAPGGDYLGGALLLAIPQQSQRQEAAWSFVRFFAAEAAGQNATFLATGAFPTYRPAWDDPAYSRPVDFFGGQLAYRAMAEAAASLPPILVSPHDQAIAPLVRRELDELLRGRKDADQAMADAERAALAAIPGLVG